MTEEEEREYGQAIAKLDSGVNELDSSADESPRQAGRFEKAMGAV